MDVVGGLVGWLGGVVLRRNIFVRVHLPTEHISRYGSEYENHEQGVGWSGDT